MNFLSFIVAPFVALGAMLGGYFAPEPQLGATEAIPVTIAFFETTLASSISADATSFTLTSATDKDGTTLASSTYAFVIDEGSANEEIVIADCTATACTNATRGISVRTGNTSVASLKYSHRRGASIKITDAPILMLVTRALRGDPVVNFTPDESYDLATKAYVDSLALGTTTVPATALDDGLVELATGTEAASSTATGNSGSPLVLHTTISTSTAPTTGSYVVVTGADGNIADGLLGTTSVTQYAVSYASTSVYTTAGTSTYVKPSNLKFVMVEVVGGGGGGGGSDSSTSWTGVAGGGGSGGYGRVTFAASTLASSTTYVVGAGGAAGASTPANGSTGDPSKFGTCIANGGNGGGADEGANGGGGGSTTGCHINATGGSGMKGMHTGEGASSDYVTGGEGGSSYMGGLGSYGSGGSSNISTNNTNVAGNAGTAGVVIITEYF